MIIPTQVVSYPRSGITLLARMLDTYFGDELQWPMTQLHSDIRYGKVGDGVNIAKNHDFKNRLEHNSDIPQFLILYRNPVRSLVSHYYIATESTPTNKGFRIFLEQPLGIRLWQRHINKWVVRHDKCISVQYEQLVLLPVLTFRRIINYMTGQDMIDKKKFLLAISIPEVKNTLKNCPFYDELLFDSIEELCEKEITNSQCPSYRDINSV
jgi:hypothetical protein